MNKTNLFIATLTICCLTACGGGGGSVTSKRAGDNHLILHQLADADYLNPVISSSANASYIQLDIFQSLLDIDFKDLQLKGQLAVDRPVIADVTSGEFSGGMSLQFEIRPEAMWDNGTPVTANDVLFTVKSIKNPKVNSGSLRPYLEFVDDIAIDADNPKKFTIYSREKYFAAETAIGGLTIMPEYVYDPQGLMKEFSLESLNEPKTADRLKANPKIMQFADAFNSPKFSREVGFVAGSGPYEFKGWETGQTIVLDRKKDWWGDKLDLPQLKGKPDRLTYKVVNDWTTAVTQMKDEALDLAYGIRNSYFLDLQKNDRFKQLFNLHTPTALAYDYFAFNLKNPKFKDKKVRQALAHLVDKQEIIDVLLYGMGESVIGPIHPTKSYYNKDLQPREYNIEKAKALLTEAGWTDSDGDGVVDKEIDGQRVAMKIQLKFNSGNDRRKNMCLLFKESAKRAGVEVEVVTREWTAFLEENKRREFEMFCAGWIQSPTPDDLKQVWHTESDTPDGSNYTGFGTPETDKIIETIKVTIDPAAQAELYKRIQAIIYEEQPYLFLVSPQERIAIHSRFEGESSLRRPGYDEKTLTIKAQP